MTTTQSKYPEVNFKMIRAWLLELRMYRQVSLKVLSEKTGYSTTHLCEIEEGKAPISVTILFRILDALECDLVLRRRKVGQQHKLFNEQLEASIDATSAIPNGIDILAEQINNAIKEDKKKRNGNKKK